MDSVGLESVGFCRGSILAWGQQRWMLAVPGGGSDEVSTSLPSPLSTSHWRLSFPTWAWAWASLALGCRNTTLHRPRGAVASLGLSAGCSSRGLGMGLRLVTCAVFLVVKVRKEAHSGDWCLWEDQAPSMLQMDEWQGLRPSGVLGRYPDRSSVDLGAGTCAGKSPADQQEVVEGRPRPW